MDNRIQILAIIGSISLLIFIIILIRQHRLKEEYSLLWLFFTIFFIIFSFWRNGLEWISDLMGIAYPPAALFLILIMALFVIMIEFSLIISKQSERIKSIGQNIGLMKQEISELHEKLDLNEKDKGEKS
ncbi:MAG: hypothetical protein ACJAT9_000203 [Polaribacter sp.]|jgi:hypothetical protein|tara:strand:- start:205 stop:591 length:387 start_codon:yes stop_codon:yes gene_type:complete